MSRNNVGNIPGYDSGEIMISVTKIRQSPHFCGGQPQCPFQLDVYNSSSQGDLFF